MDVVALIADPSLIHDVEDYNLELSAREVVEHLAGANALADRDSYATADAVLEFASAICLRNPDFACAFIIAYARLNGNINMLIARAAKRKNDPAVSPFLVWLKTSINNNANKGAWRRGRLIVRRAEERGCMWTGANAAETRRAVARFKIPPA